MSCQHCGREHPAQTVQCPVTGEPMAAAGLLGTRVDRYALEALLGCGGFGSVYRARHVHTDVLVALKLLKKAMSTDEQMVARFLREAKAAAAVGNAHIVGVLDAGVAADGQAFLALEFLDGMDLKELAFREGPLDARRVVELTLQALDGLDAAHQRGIVHRDMKPANVFVTRREQGDFVKLLDFGISKMRDQGEAHGLTMTGVAMGTPTYMAPEQFFDARSVDGRADVYSVAVMLYELLSHRLPFDAESYAALIVKVRTEEAPALSEVAPKLPAALAHTVMVGLSKDPMKRWQSARDFASSLREALPAEGLPLATPVRLEPAPRARVTDAPPALSQYVSAAELQRTAKPAQVSQPPSQPRPAPVSPAAPVPVAQPLPLSRPLPLSQPLAATPLAAAPKVAPAPRPARSPLKTALIVVAVLFGLFSCCVGSLFLAGVREAAQQEALRKANEP